MPGADVLHFSIGRSVTHDHSRELPRRRALAKQSIRVLHELIQRQVLPRQRAECRMQMAHQHRSRHAFP